MPSPLFNYLMPLVLLQVSLLPKLPLALDAYLSDDNETVIASMPTYPLSFSNSTFFLDRVPLYVLSKAESANSCEIEDFPSQWSFVVLLHEETICGKLDTMLNLCDRKGCLGVIFTTLDAPSFAGWLAYIAAGPSNVITSRTPVMYMEAFPSPQLEWLLREGASEPGAVLISARSDEYNEGAAVLSSWKFRSVGIILALHSIANIVAILWKLLVKILDLRDGKKMPPKPRSPLNHNTSQRICGLPIIDIWHPLFVLLPELIAGVIIAVFWINITFFRAQGITWSLFRFGLTGFVPFMFTSTFTTAFVFSRITLKNQYSKQRSWSHKLAGSLTLRVVFSAVVLTDISLLIYTAITEDEIFPPSFISVFYTIMQFLISIYFIVGGNKMVKLLSKGGSSSSLRQAKNLKFANCVWWSGIAMLGLSASLISLELSVTTFPSAPFFWCSFALSAHIGQWVSSTQIRAIVVRRQFRAALKPVAASPLPPSTSKGKK